MIDLTTLFNALIALMAAVITAFVIPWIRSKTTAQQRALLESVVKTLVFAAEQLFGAGNGEQKLQYVIDRLKLQGYTVDLALIEATVNANFGHWGSWIADEEEAPGVEEAHPPETADQ